MYVFFYKYLFLLLILLLIFFWLNWILKEQNKRKIFLTTELRKNVLKSLLASDFFFFDFKFYFQNFFLKFTKNSAISFYRNKCLVHNWSRSVFKLFKMSRHQSKAFASSGFFCGLRKASF